MDCGEGAWAVHPREGEGKEGPHLCLSLEWGLGSLGSANALAPSSWLLFLGPVLFLSDLSVLISPISFPQPHAHTQPWGSQKVP